MNRSLSPIGQMTPLTYQKAAFRYFFERAITYSTEIADLKSEIEYIMDIGEQHGYRRSFIESIRRNVQKTLKSSKVVVIQEYS